MLRKRASMRFRTIGKLVMPKFLNDNNNNISKTNGLHSVANGTVGSSEQVEAISATDAATQQMSLKVERIRRKFMVGSSTPIVAEGRTTSVDEGSDSNMESGKENNYDSGGEYRAKAGAASGIAALKRNLLKDSRSQNKSILINSSMELDEVVVKGKVSTMAKQWNKLRALSIDVSSIRPSIGSATQSPPCNGNISIEERACESLPYDHDSEHFSTNTSSLLEKSSFHLNKSKRRNSPLIDERIAKYFGLKSAKEPATSSPATIAEIQTTPNSELDLSKCRRRSRSTPRGNPPAPPPQRPVAERIAKYFGINKSFNGSPSAPQCINKPRAIVKPRVLQVDSAPRRNLNRSEDFLLKGRRRSRSLPRDDYLEELPYWQGKAPRPGDLLNASFCLTGLSNSLLKPLRNFDEFNLTAEDLSLADTEFDKLYLD